MSSRPQNRYAIVPASPDDIGTLLRVYIDSFYEREPLTSCLGLSKERMAAIASAMYGGESGQDFARQLSFLAQDPDADANTVGFVLCDDPADPNANRLPPNLTEQELLFFPSVAALLETVRAPINTRIGKRPGEYLHIAALGVMPGCEGKGLATSLLQAALQEARRRGFRHAFAECTSAASRACHEKCGFSTINHVSGDDFTHADTRPFAGRRLDIHLMERDLE